MDVPAGQIAWVWTEPPSDLTGFDGALVKVADGGSNTSGNGFPYLPNWAAWHRRHPRVPLGAWSFVYPTTDPARGARALASAGGAAYYCLDVEDYQGATVGWRTIDALVAALRQLDPGKPIGFSTYATRAQAMDHQVPWDTCLRVCDFSSPQVYYGYQLDQLAQAVRDAKGKPVLTSLSPADSPARWDDAARAELDRAGTVVYWRLDTLSAPVRQAITNLQEDFMALSSDDKAWLTGLLDDKVRMLDHGDPDVGGHGYHHQVLYDAIRAGTGPLLDDESKTAALGSKIVELLQADPAERIDEQALAQHLAEILHTLGVPVTIADADIQRAVAGVLERAHLTVDAAAE